MTLSRLAWALCLWPALAVALPPPPVPPENPVTEEKRILGKILFWDEQLASDGTVACGTCHQFKRAGSDGRRGVHPGVDEVFGTADDVVGSPGVVRRDAGGHPVNDPLFGVARQVTMRNGLTDSRVASAAFPFDQPILRSERGDANGDGSVDAADRALFIGATPAPTAARWPAAARAAATEASRSRVS